MVCITLVPLKADLKGSLIVFITENQQAALRLSKAAKTLQEKKVLCLGGKKVSWKSGRTSNQGLAFMSL